MTVYISQIEDAEYKLVDLIWRLGPGRRRDDCNAALVGLRKIKSDLLAQFPDVLRKGFDMDKRSHQAARDQRLHDALRDAGDGHVCASYAARDKIHSGVVDTEAHLHRAHHALVEANRCKCEGANTIPGGRPDASGEEERQGTRFGEEDKLTAARASGLAKRLGVPVPIPARSSDFCWEVNGAQAGLDHLDRTAEVDRINNKYRRSQGLVPLQ